MALRAKDAHSAFAPAPMSANGHDIISVDIMCIRQYLVYI